MDVFYRAFQELNTDRQVGMTIGPIMFSSINAYAQRYGFNEPDIFDWFLWTIRILDQAWLASQK